MSTFSDPPSAEMLKAAEVTLGSLASRAELIEGYVDTAPEGPFDGATCLLTLHFLPAEERLHTLGQLRRRLKPGAPLVVAHHSFPQTGREKLRWLERYAAFAASSGVPASNANKAIEAIGARLPCLRRNRTLRCWKRRDSRTWNCSTRASRSGDESPMPHADMGRRD